MDGSGDNKVRDRMIKAGVLVAVLLIPICFVLFKLGKYYDGQREKEREQLRTDTFSKIMVYGNTEREAAEKQFDTNLSKELELTVSILKESVTEENYEGPRVFDDGFIVELQGENVIVPKYGQKGEMQISRALIEESIGSGDMRTGRLLFPNPDQDEQDSSGDEPPDEGYYLSFAKITDSLIYVEMTADAAFEEYIRLYTPDGMSALKTAAEMFDGAALLVRDNDGQLEQLAQYGQMKGTIDLAKLGITAAKVRNMKAFEVTLDSETYRCVVIKADDIWLGRENAYIIQMIPTHSLTGETLAQGVTICLLMLLILFTMVVYILSEQRYVREHVLDEAEAKQYNPNKIRKRIISAGAIGAVVIFAVSFMTHAVGQMYQKTRYGNDTLELLQEKYAQNMQEEQQQGIKKAQENWYVKYCDEMAAFLSEKPEAATAKKLTEFCEILKTDYIMLFDSKGNEILCNRDYVGFTLDRGLGDNSSDFRRLLMGVPSVVHEPSTDKTTGLERQMIGVKMTAPDDPLKHGALVMALMPDQTKGEDSKANIAEETALLKTEGVLCFIADSTTGEILYSGDLSMVGSTVTECGLTEKSLQDGYMDYGTVNGVKRFIITEKSDDTILYYATKYQDLRKENLILSGCATILFLLAYVIVVCVLMKGYTAEQFAEWSGKELPFEGKANSLLNKLFKWDQRKPEKKASLVFYAGLFVILQLWVRLILGQEIANEQYGSLFNYLLIGNWMKGINLFSLCSILMVTAIANLIVTLSNWGLHLLAGFLSAKGETICMLIESIIKYVAIVAVIIISLGYVGVLNSTVIASLGIGSLALSLGAKDFVTDILAGILIVFEETMRVGDIVEYNDTCCTVVEVGMRSTKLMIPPGSYLNVSNHELTGIKNLSKKNAICSVTIRVLGKGKLEDLEEKIKKELPEISKKCDLLRGPVSYYGVSLLGSGEGSNRMSQTISLSIGAACEQKDIYAVRMFLNREICLMCEREEIDIY